MVSVGSTHRILLRVAHFDPHDVVQQPVDGFVFVEHQHELHDERQVQRLKHLTCTERSTAQCKPFMHYSSSNYTVLGQYKSSDSRHPAARKSEVRGHNSSDTSRWSSDLYCHSSVPYLNLILINHTAALFSYAQRKYSDSLFLAQESKLQTKNISLRIKKVWKTRKKKYTQK